MKKNRPVANPVVVKHQRVLGGRPVFRGTRIPAEVLFENLAEGYSIDDIAAEFPTLEPDDLRAALLQACEMIKQAAPDVTTADRESPARARVLR